MKLLFDKVPTWADPDDPDDRSELLSAQGFGAEGSPQAGFRLALYEVVASQIADDDPPEVWKTAQRLLNVGLDRRGVLRNLTMAFNASLLDTVRDKRSFDAAEYANLLELLPLPAIAEVEDIMLTIVRERQPIELEEMEGFVWSTLGLPQGQEPFATYLDRVVERIMEPEGQLVLLAGDVVVEPVSLCEGIVLTHRLTQDDRDLDALPLDVDLCVFARHEEVLRTPIGGEIEFFLEEGGVPEWKGPVGWLKGFQPGTLLGVRVEDATVSLEAVGAELNMNPDTVVALRETFEAEIDDAWVPVIAEEVVLSALARDRSAFATPQLPLTELCDAAGIEIRYGYLAHEESVWQNQAEIQRGARVTRRLDDPDDVSAVLGVMDRFETDAEDPDELRQMLMDIRRPGVFDVALDEMFGLDDDLDRIDAAAAFVERGLDIARRPEQVAVAHLIGAIVAERRQDPLGGEKHLQLAVEADRDWAPAVDRLAWYQSDRGEAAAAARLWERLGTPSDDPDLHEVEQFSNTTTGPRLGRNDPCWCGSGRKYKQCHLGRADVPPLPERVGWLCRKATAYMERRGGPPVHDLYDLALLRAGSQDGVALAGAMADPFVIDVALHELDWFGRFLVERGELLPEDEQLLAASWTLVDRTIYEVLEVVPGVSVEVQDLRTAERFDVRERTFSHQAHPGLLICGRAVPDGEGHQFIGGIFTVAPGTEAGLLALLDEKDGYRLIEYLAELERPPSLVTREGEPLVVCVAELEISDTHVAEDLMDRMFRRAGDMEWVETHDLSEGESIQRAAIHLAATRLTIETMSEARLDRLLSLMLREIEGARLLRDERRPFDPRKSQLSSISTPTAGPEIGGPDIGPEELAALDRWREETEERWCDEPIPALGHLTPRQAVADPTRREAVERLLASYEEMDRRSHDQGFVALRVTRLRRLLLLPPP